jgi:hypothetical protein
LRLSRYLRVPTAHRYLRFELAARVLLPLLPPILLGASAWQAVAGRGEYRWLPLPAMATAMVLYATVIGWQARSWQLPLLYGPIHLVMLPVVRAYALLTLGDSRWGTRNVLRPWRAVEAAPVPIVPGPASGPPVTEQAGP